MVEFDADVLRKRVQPLANNGYGRYLLRPLPVDVEPIVSEKDARVQRFEDAVLELRQDA